MKLYWDSHALFLLGESEGARRLLQESLEGKHKPITSSWAVAIARENLGRKARGRIPSWERALSVFREVPDHTEDRSLELPEDLLIPMSAALRAQANRFITGDPAVRTVVPSGKFQKIRIMTLTEWMRELHGIPEILPYDPNRSTINFTAIFEPKSKGRK